MINRINLILRAKNITARQFAEEIGIQPSGMSHIMGGRNNPSLEFVSKVLRRYPEIDANWLLLGRGEMYNTAGATSLAEMKPMDLFTNVEKTDSKDDIKPDTVPTDDADSADAYDSNVSAEPSYNESTYMDVPLGMGSSSSVESGRRLVRMLLIYSDNTFCDYVLQG